MDVKYRIVSAVFLLASLVSAVLPSGEVSAKSAGREYVEPRDTAVVSVAGWAGYGGVSFGWVPKDYHYRQFASPVTGGCADTVVSAWRGERIGLEALVASGVDCGRVGVRLTGFRNGRGKRVAMPGSSASLMRYVITTGWRACGYPSANLPTYTVADMIDREGSTADLEACSVRPVWVTVEVPRDLPPGEYKCEVELVSESDGEVLKRIGLTVRVGGNTLPRPMDYAFYLDMWQQPYAVSRYYGVEPWSAEHMRLLEPYADMLARVGQKTVSVILFYEPWGEQSHDKFEPMVQTVRRADGTWAYDYGVMDRYVEFMGSRGVDANISCFTMVPWEMKFRYYDEASGEYRYLEAGTDTEAYRDLWTSFLRSLASHLRERGWFEKTMITMDERGLRQMLDARRVAKGAVPDIKMSLAGSYHAELADSLESYALIKGDFFPADVMRARRERGLITLMYTCCATAAPSQFSNSAPADGAYIPVYATATGHDGYLHWSYQNWTDEPLTDTRFRMFAPGDTYFVYPDGRSSLRYERMAEGVQLSEKIRLLREQMTERKDYEGLLLLEAALEPIRSGAMNEWYTTAMVVNDLTRAVDVLSER